MNNKTGANNRVDYKFYYTDYVVHMIKFYLSTPDGLDLQKRQYTASSISNWSAVQMVFRRMSDSDREIVGGVFGCFHYLPKAVDMYCRKTGTDMDEVWKVLKKVFAKIAQVRGLM